MGCVEDGEGDDCVWEGCGGGDKGTVELVEDYIALL